MIRNILWCGEGVLFDTGPATTYAMSRSLSEMGYSLALNVIGDLFHMSFDEGVEILAQRFKLDPSLLRRQFETVYLTVSPHNQTPFPDTREVCALIRKQGGVNLLITSRNLQSTKALLQAHQMDSCLDDIFWMKPGALGKPDQEKVRAALEKHTLDPVETLLIGKRASDIQAGRAGGVRTCLFRPVDLAETVDLHIEQYSQLVEILQGKQLAWTGKTDA